MSVANDRDIRVVLPIILVVVGVILALLLRSLVLPATVSLLGRWNW